jgi:hypothetical protein
LWAHPSQVNRTIKLAQNAPTSQGFFVWRSGDEFSWLSLKERERGEAMIFHPSKVGLLTKVNAISSPLFEVGGSIQRLH